MTEKRKIKEMIIRDFGSNKISCGQSSRGIWTVNTIDIYADSVSDALVLAEHAMLEANKILKKVNEPVEQNETIKKERNLENYSRRNENERIC